MTEQERKENQNRLDATIIEKAGSTTKKYSDAAREYQVAYSGYDATTGTTLKKSLKSISKEKLNENPKERKKNIKQQSGFSAEVISVADENAKNIIEGYGIRKIRTDDNGSVNDPLYDHQLILIDEKGNTIAGSGTQMKFLGKDPKQAVNKLLEKKNQKYFDANVTIEVQKDFFKGMQKEIKNRKDKLTEQIAACEKAGKNDQAEQLREKYKKLEKVHDSLKQSSVTKEEAKFARLHPELETAKKIAGVSHQAGVEVAKESATMAATVSVLQNTKDVFKGEKKIEDAAVEVVKDTGSAFAKGYVTGAVETTAKSVLKNSKSSTIKQVGSVLDGEVLGRIVAVGGIVNNGITNIKNGEGLGETAIRAIEDGVGYIVSETALFIGDFFGGPVGAAACEYIIRMAYDTVIAVQREYRLSKKQLKEIKKVEKYVIDKQKEIQSQIKEYSMNLYEEHKEAFSSMIYQVQEAMKCSDVNKLFDSVNSFGKAYGVEFQFKTFEEFDNFMSNENTEFVF